VWRGNHAGPAPATGARLGARAPTWDSFPGCARCLRSRPGAFGRAESLKPETRGGGGAGSLYLRLRPRPRPPCCALAALRAAPSPVPGPRPSPSLYLGAPLGLPRPCHLPVRPPYLPTSLPRLLPQDIRLWSLVYKESSLHFPCCYSPTAPSQRVCFILLHFGGGKKAVHDHHTYTCTPTPGPLKKEKKKFNIFCTNFPWKVENNPVLSCSLSHTSSLAVLQQL
jgi:hypothetical protein